MLEKIASSEQIVQCILVINSGSSSIKFSIFHGTKIESLLCIRHGAIERLDQTSHLYVVDEHGHHQTEQRWNNNTSHEDLLIYLIEWLEKDLGSLNLTAIGHRVVHGGITHTEPRLITEKVLVDLRAAEFLAPLHQAHNLSPIYSFVTSHPHLPQVACFDTGFHASNSKISRMYGLPQKLTSEGVLRFGFHGLSYEYIASQLPRFDHRASSGRTIVAHLGNGVSMCALVNGKSVASSMGFSALDGLLMGSRCGALDPGVLLYLLQKKCMSVQEIETLLYQQSGLLGVSGISSDMRELLSSKDVHAQEAVDLFVYRVAREIGSLAAAAGGLDALVFTAGIGEHSSEIRARICSQSEWLGINLSKTANESSNPCISEINSRVSVWVIPTDEELMIARHTFTLVDHR